MYRNTKYVTTSFSTAGSQNIIYLQYYNNKNTLCKSYEKYFSQEYIVLDF